MAPSGGQTALSLEIDSDLDLPTLLNLCRGHYEGHLLSERFQSAADPSELLSARKVIRAFTAVNCGNVI